MKPSHAQHNDFLSHKPVPGVVLGHNDSVDIIGGEHAGDSGAVISVEEIGDDPLYLIELGSGKDAIVRQSLLRLIAAD